MSGYPSAPGRATSVEAGISRSFCERARAPHPTHPFSGRGRKPAPSDPGPSEQNLLRAGDASGREKTGAEGYFAWSHGVDVVRYGLHPSNSTNSQHRRCLNVAATARDERSRVCRHLHGEHPQHRSAATHLRIRYLLELECGAERVKSPCLHIPSIDIRQHGIQSRLMLVPTLLGGAGITDVIGERSRELGTFLEQGKEVRPSDQT